MNIQEKEKRLSELKERRRQIQEEDVKINAEIDEIINDTIDADDRIGKYYVSHEEKLYSHYYFVYDVVYVEMGNFRTPLYKCVVLKYNISKFEKGSCIGLDIVCHHDIAHATEIDIDEFEQKRTEIEEIIKDRYTHYLTTKK